MDIHELEHVRGLERENLKLKYMYAELGLDPKILKEKVSRNL